MGFRYVDSEVAKYLLIYNIYCYYSTPTRTWESTCAQRHSDYSDCSVCRIFLLELFSGSFLVGLAIDMVSGLVYFTEGGADIIAAVTLDGRQHFTLVTEDMDEPQDIVLDLERG